MKITIYEIWLRLDRLPKLIKVAFANHAHWLSMVKWQMRIKSICIKNFRSFKDCTIDLENYTSFVGPNGAGKSTVLCALNVFFREMEGSATNINELDIEDFHARDTREPIEITVTFCDLSEAAQKDFSEYFRQNSLIVTAKAVFDPAIANATVKQYGQRLAIAEFSKFFELHNNGKAVGELRSEYTILKSTTPGLPSINTKDGMRDALREFEEKHPERCVLIPSEDQFYGFSRGSNRLAKHIQWIYVPAVKDATKENVEAKNTALGKILARTVRSKVQFGEQITKLKEDTQERYRALLNAQQGALDEISKSLTQRLAQWAHPEAKAHVSWTEDPKKSVQVDEPIARLLAGEGDFMGELARFGHGLQRSYLLAVLQELAAIDDADAPTLILGCEEPELYQHPPQARHLAGVMQKLGEGNAQILVSTHSPYFVSGRHFESLRMVRRDPAKKQSSISAVSFETIASRLAAVTGETAVKPAAEQARLQQALQPHLNEMFFAPKIIFVEGIEDTAYITSWLILSGKWDEFRQHGAHFVAVNGKSYLVEPVIVAKELNIPVFVIFDADGNIANADNRPKHEKDNKALLTLLSGDAKQPFPSSTVWSEKFVQWPINFRHTLKSEVGNEDWDKTFGEAMKELGNPEGSYTKNPIHIGNHVEILRNKGTTPASIEKLCDELLRFSAAR